jgi:predicted MFS family arabinose efflux permease
VFIPLIQLMLDELGWRGALAVLGGINLIVCAGVYLAVIDPSADAPHPASAENAPPPLDGRPAVARVARQPAFWALAVAFTAYTATFSAFLFHLYPLLLERGFDAGTVVATMAVIGPAQVAGRIGIWVFARHTSVRTIGAVTVLGLPAAFIALAVFPPSFAIVAGAAALYGAANGIMTIVRGFAVPEMLTREAYGAVNGALTAPATIAKALAPAGAALIWASAGSYDAVLLAVIAGSLVMVAGFWSAVALSGRARLVDA